MTLSRRGVPEVAVMDPALRRSARFFGAIPVHSPRVTVCVSKSQRGARVRSALGDRGWRDGRPGSMIMVKEEPEPLPLGVSQRT